jgi:hypothetical protein
MKKHFILALVFYILPVILFGNIYTLNNTIVLVFSTLLISFFINFKAIDGKDWPTYVYSFIHGASLSILGISILGITVKNPMISISVKLESIPAIISTIGFITFSKLYRERKRLEYLKQFEGNNILLNRDQKINQIINSWFN